MIFMRITKVITKVITTQITTFLPANSHDHLLSSQFVHII